MRSLDDEKTFTWNDLCDYSQEKHYAVIYLIQAVMKLSFCSFLLFSFSLLTSLVHILTFHYISVLFFFVESGQSHIEFGGFGD